MGGGTPASRGHKFAFIHNTKYLHDISVEGQCKLFKLPETTISHKHIVLYYAHRQMRNNRQNKCEVGERSQIVVKSNNGHKKMDVKSKSMGENGYGCINGLHHRQITLKTNTVDSLIAFI